ncbi:hypothetical protein HMI48_09895 [Acidithiobacillus ferrooxidans]|uniref:hypothetical protein n=1 Tax=Acidithiobacillus ferrooxidans TaxID=920 RepID=UPI001C073E38|nr:hypothetical protein [Acidithiobacillus ferrooxidans]MBU2774174.1 hypothetical protein [Acidithiobacillus ferrooxidans]
MHRSSLWATPPAITQQAQAVAVRPATSEQALEMLDLMLADVIAQAEGTMAGWAERLPLDDQDAAQSKALEVAAKDRLSQMTQAYARKHGHLNVSLISLGSDYGAMHAALRPVIDKVAEAKNT